MDLNRFSTRDKEALDRPIWSSLTSKHRSFALGVGRACRYPPAVSPFAAVSESSAAAMCDLRDLAKNGPVALLSLSKLEPLEGLKVRVEVTLHQMILTDDVSSAWEASATILGPHDVPSMLELAALTRPGPFYPETHRLGRYVGVRDGTRLVAMAGERLSFDGFTEISAVGVHPDYRGKGYAKILIGELAKMIFSRGETPILHVHDGNLSAIALYKRLGFVTRTNFHFTLMNLSDAS